jgi:branched-chain amino acid transport system permease protein
VAKAQVTASSDQGAHRRGSVHGAALLVVAALIALPWVEPDKFALHVISLIAIASIAAMGLQVLLGYSGQLSIGQAAFYGIGAYTSAF